MNSDTTKSSDEMLDNNPLECRLCLQRVSCDAKTYSLLETWDPPWDGMDETIASDLDRLAQIKIELADELSKIICIKCHGELKKACKFVKLVKKNDSYLRSTRSKVETDTSKDNAWPKPIQVDQNMLGVYNSPMDIDIKQEILSDDECNTHEVNNGDEVEQNSEDYNLVEIKVEPEEIVPQDLPHAVFNGPNGTYSSGDLIPTNLTNGSREYIEEEFLDGTIKEEPLSEEESATPDLPLECMLCAKTFKSVSGLKAHVIAQHSYKTVKRKLRSSGASPEKRSKSDKHVCATCRRTFATSTDLIVHETCHGKQTCYVCRESFDTFVQLSKHRKRCKATKDAGPQKLKTLDDVKRTTPEATKTDNNSESGTQGGQTSPESFSDDYCPKIQLQDPLATKTEESSKKMCENINIVLSDNNKNDVLDNADVGSVTHEVGSSAPIDCIVNQIFEEENGSIESEDVASDSQTQGTPKESLENNLASDNKGNSDLELILGSTNADLNDETKSLGIKSVVSDNLNVVLNVNDGIDALSDNEEEDSLESIFGIVK